MFKPAGSDPKLTVFHHRNKKAAFKQSSMINKNSSGQLNKDLMKDFARHGINLNPLQTKTVRTFSRNDESGGHNQAINTTFGDRSAGEEAFKLNTVGPDGSQSNGIL